MTIVRVNHNREAIDKTDNIITIDNKRVVEIVEDGIVKEIELEGDSSIAYSRDSLKYICVPVITRRIRIQWLATNIAFIILKL
jgi:hypothetical protein